MNHMLLRKKCEMRTMLPSMIPATVMSCESRFAMCDISCATTPWSSSRLSFDTRPAVTAMALFSGFIPIANALGAGSSMMYTLGIPGSPEAIFISSTTLKSRGWTSFVTSFARLIFSRISSPDVTLMRVSPIQIAIATARPKYPPPSGS